MDVAKREIKIAAVIMYVGEFLVETLFAGQFQSLIDGENTNLFTIRADQADRCEPDSFIDTHLGCFWIVSERELADDLPPLFLGCLRSRPKTRPD